MMFMLFWLRKERTRNSVDRGEIHTDYAVQVSEDQSRFHVTATLSGLQPGTVLLQMTENYGRVKDVSGVLSGIEIRSGHGARLNVDTISEFLWELTVADSSGVIIRYDVNTRNSYSTLNMVRLPHRDDDHLYFPAASALVYPKSRAWKETDIKRISITFDLPQGWQAVTSWGTGKSGCEIEIPSFESLNSGLIGLGRYRVYEDSASAPSVCVAILGSGRMHTGNGNGRQVSDAEILSTTRAALESGRKIFGFSPINRYVSLVHFILDEPDEMHGNALGWTTNVNYSKHFDESRWAELTSHVFSEIFHLWNGTEGPPLSRSQSDTAATWFTEGVTHYYRLKNMYMSGVLSEIEYFELIGTEVNIVANSARGAKSLDALSSAYYSDQSAMRLTYSKGASVAFALDNLLRQTSHGRRSLDNVMRALLARFDYRITRQGFSSADLDDALREVLGPEAYSSYRRLFGERFDDEFQYVMERCGIVVKRREGRRLIFGITNFARSLGPPYVAEQIDVHSAAFDAGLRPYDILSAVDGERILKKGDLERILSAMDEDAEVNLTVVGDGKPLVLRTKWCSIEQEIVLDRR